MKKKNLLLAGLSFIAITVSAQAPRLGKSPLDQVIKAMTLNEKIHLLECILLAQNCFLKSFERVLRLR